MAARSVGDLKCADSLVAGDDLPVGVLYGGDVALVEGAVDKPQNQASLPHTLIVVYLDNMKTRRPSKMIFHKLAHFY